MPKVIGDFGGENFRGCLWYVLFLYRYQIWGKFSWQKERRRRGL